MQHDKSRNDALPTLTVVIPAHQAAGFLDLVFDGLRRGGFDPSATIVVDDGSSDTTSEVARRNGAKVLRNERSQGPSLARNRGVDQVTTDLVCFVDADVVVHPDSCASIIESFRADPGLTALLCSYDTDPSAPGLVSRYRNLLHNYVHQNSAGEIGTFWTGFGVVKTSVFKALDGFDPSTENIEDVDFGMRLNAAGYKAVLDPSILCTHLKNWSLSNMLSVDLFGRAIPWTRLLLFRHGFSSQLYTTGHHRLNVVLVGLLALVLLSAPFLPDLLMVALLVFSTFVLTNLRFFGYLWRTGGAALAVTSVPLHILHFGAAGAGFVWVILRDYLPSRLFGR